MAVRRIFWCFCRIWFLIDPLHDLSSRSDFGFEFAEIFLIEKRLPESARKIVKFENKICSRKTIETFIKTVWYHGKDPDPDPGTVLRIRITFMRIQIRIPLFTLMRFRIQLFTLMQIQIRLFTLMCMRILLLVEGNLRPLVHRPSTAQFRTSTPL